MKKLLAFFFLFFIYLETKSAEHQIVSFPPISEELSDSGQGSSRSLTPTQSIEITTTYHWENQITCSDKLRFLAHKIGANTNPLYILPFNLAGAAIFYAGLFSGPALAVPVCTLSTLPLTWTVAAVVSCYIKKPQKSNVELEPLLQEESLYSSDIINVFR